MSKIEHPLLGSFIFVHSKIDDAGLSANEFRVYAHLARRAGSGAAFPAVASIADVCRIHKDTVWAVLKSLESRGMVVRVNRTGATNVYKLTEPSAWTHPSDSGSGKQGAPETEGWGVAENKGWEAPETEGYEGTPLKEIQRRRSKETKIFTPPTEAEWIAYCTSTWSDWHRSGEAWAHYQAVGWVAGKAKIKDWKAAARTSHSRAKDWGTLGQPMSEADAYWEARRNANR